MPEENTAANLTIRVGLLEGYDRVDFRMHGRYRMESLAGTPIRDAVSSDLKWRAKIEEAESGQFLYTVLVSVLKWHEGAIALAESFEKQGQIAVVRQIGGPIDINGRVVGDNTMYRVQVGNYRSEEEASAHLDGFPDDYSPRVVREVLKKQRGKIELFDAQIDETYSVNDGVRLIPADDDAHVTICRVRKGSGFDYEDDEDRDYSGVIEIYIDHTGNLAALTKIPIDVYLKGTVPAEMPASFPPEALKAQTILARSYVLSRRGIEHLNDPYDVCAHVHCQVYSGITHEDERTNAAVEETRGQLLMANGGLVDARYSAVCGGHTEDAKVTWMTPPMHPTNGVLCSCDGKLEIPDLATESGVAKWIRSFPDVCCNLIGRDVPAAADYSQRYFRWEISVPRSELEEIIREKTGEDIGTLYDILPLRRGRSGRLQEIEILGSRKNLRIKRERRIRRALSHTALQSSCFMVDIVQDSSGMPYEIVFTGAGYGHGVGMCQWGAASAAYLGWPHEQILSHYFPGTTIEKLY